MPSSRKRYEGSPSLAQVMRQPKWIGALLLALAVAGGFAWLGQWQLGHAITTNASEIDSETATPIDQVTSAGAAVGDDAAGRVVTVTGGFVEGDYLVVEQRMNDGAEGAWIVGHFAGERGSLAVAVAWAEDSAAATAAIPELEQQLADTPQIEGRYMPAEAPVLPEPGDDPFRILGMSPAQLVNLWQSFPGSSYSGFLVLHPAGLSDTAAFAGLQIIDSVAPLPAEAINWLNLFYAVEWVVFAGFAVFFWYRLARDDWEKIHELRLLAERADAAQLPADVG